MAPRQGIGQGRQAEREGVGTHVPAVGEQGHGLAQVAGGDLHHHGDQGEQGHPAGTPLRRAGFDEEGVGMGAARRNGGRSHGGRCYSPVTEGAVVRRANAVA